MSWRGCPVDSRILTRLLRRVPHDGLAPTGSNARTLIRLLLGDYLCQGHAQVLELQNRLRGISEAGRAAGAGGGERAQVEDQLAGAAGAGQPGQPRMLSLNW